MKKYDIAFEKYMANLLREIHTYRRQVNIFTEEKDKEMEKGR
jgi:hypothetical protein